MLERAWVSELIDGQTPGEQGKAISEAGKAWQEPSPRRDARGALRSLPSSRGLTVYRGSDGHVHELRWSGSVNHRDLTRLTGEPPAVGDPVGYAGGTTQNVVYRRPDGHVQVLYAQRSDRWGHYSPSVDTGASPAAGDPGVYTWGPSESIVYRGHDLRIHVLWWDGAIHHGIIS